MVWEGCEELEVDDDEDEVGGMMEEEEDGGDEDEDRVKGRVAEQEEQLGLKNPIYSQESSLFTPIYTLSYTHLLCVFLCVCLLVGFIRDHPSLCSLPSFSNHLTPGSIRSYGFDQVAELYENPPEKGGGDGGGVVGWVRDIFS